MKPPFFLRRSLPCSAAAMLLLAATGCQVKPASSTFATTAQPGQTSSANTPAAASAPAASAATTTAVAGAAADGWTTTPSGLRYQVLASGPEGGRSPTINDTVTVHYRGTLTNGSVFDSSYDRGAPASFGVGQVIPGWTEALQLMKPGDKWMLYIPSRLAYGPQSMGDKIPANSDLIFQVELLQVASGY